MTQLTGPEEHQLRLALGMIGEAAGGDEPDPPPSALPARRKRPGTIVGALVAVAALALVLLAYGLADGDSGGAQQEQGQALSHTEMIACSPMIVEGDVVAVRDHPGQDDAVKVTLTVTEWIKPSQGAERQIQFTALSAKEMGEYPYRKGEHMLVVVRDRPDEPADTFRVDGAGTSRTLEFERNRIDQNLAAAAKTECPAFWRHRDEDSGGRADS
ncbi:hypothetical protein [Streptomyces sporangiiformans]|uniref:Uncharacterized protein n=1 Tax=Streptomyces sporangiiformans TaxID=2315329 RepID=A0A505DR73_9ACTN|nr:hypothetical protein [Streptomyces sporangiiformans]TPQ23685.1 hypothetical protein FGD71_002890 [Streptomyces sporangiiformans]